MYILLVFILSVFSIVPQTFLDDPSNTYAVLVAGAFKWENYWSQAQVCAAYQQLHSAGVPDERIILWLYDDIANNWRNPHKGHLYLYKGGPDVYKNIPKDLVGKDITPQNYMKLLRGENMTIGSGKSLKSGKNDRLFIYFSDHGGPGVMYFPGFVEFHVADFIDTLKFMHKNEMYKEMVFYLDTCHSGSMFNGLIDPTMNIYAATSVDPLNVAWLCDCHDIPIDHYCQSNCWAKYYILDTEASMANGTFKKRTFEEQYFAIRNETLDLKQQTACRYGNMDISRNNALYKFQGTGEDANEEFKVVKSKKGGKSEKMVKITEYKLYRLKSEFEKTKSGESRKKLENYEEYMKNVDERWRKFAEKLGISIPNVDPQDCYPSPIKPSCMKELVILAKSLCGSFDEYSLKYMTLLNQACQEDKKRIEIENVLKDVCIDN